jgi:hypothetical protein
VNKPYRRELLWIKIAEGTVAMVAWLLFLILIGEDCLRWYIIPVSSNSHRILFAGMVCVSGASCLLAFRNLMRVRQLWQGMMLKLLGAPPEMETKAESGVYYTRLSLTSALCFYIVVAVWGIVYLSKGPFVKTGDLALSVLVAYHFTATVAGVKLERLKRSMKLKQAKV